MRQARINEIEIAKVLYTLIIKALSGVTRLTFSENSHDDGCMYQFFCYIQQILVHFIFVNFHSIIGNYDTKNNCLKSWEQFHMSAQDICLLNTIRERYSPVRNNFIAHMSIEFELNDTDNVSMMQIEEDINHIRNILNTIRRSNAIPTLIQSYAADEHYAVQGIQKLFGLLLKIPE